MANVTVKEDMVVKDLVEDGFVEEAQVVVLWRCQMLLFVVVDS